MSEQEQEKPRTRARRGQAAAAQMKAMLAVVKPAEQAEAEPAPGPAARPSRAKRTAAKSHAAPPMAADQGKPAMFPHRVTLPLTRDQWLALKQARNDDEIEHSYRVRAAVVLWMQDERLRARIDKLAAQESQRDKQRRGYR